MTCPYLEYRSSDGERSFDAERAYCTAAGRFVQPMRADVCNDRYDLRHDEHCEIYLSATDEEADGDGSTADTVANGDGTADGDRSAVGNGTGAEDGPDTSGGD